MSLTAQDVIVTLLALGAAWVIVRRVFGVFRPGKSSPACDSCASGAAACARPESEQPGDKPVPVVLHRR